MKIKFTKEYRAMKENDICNIYNVGMVWEDVPPTSAQWLIDNGFAEEVKESGWWRPEIGEDYYFLSNVGEVIAEPWLGSEVDEFRYLVGNCFKTKDATERYRDYLKAIATVRQDDGVLTPAQIRDEYCDSYIHYIGVRQNGQLVVNCISVESGTIIASAIYFDTYKHAKASLDKHSDEWKIIANYDWSRE